MASRTKREINANSLYATRRHPFILPLLISGNLKNGLAMPKNPYFDPSHVSELPLGAKRWFFQKSGHFEWKIGPKSLPDQLWSQISRHPGLGWGRVIHRWKGMLGGYKNMVRTHGSARLNLVATAQNIKIRPKMAIFWLFGSFFGGTGARLGGYDTPLEPSWLGQSENVKKSRNRPPPQDARARNVQKWAILVRAPTSGPNFSAVWARLGLPFGG